MYAGCNRDVSCIFSRYRLYKYSRTSTPAGDIAEIKAIQKVFEDYKVPISSTKSLTGHGLGASGVSRIDILHYNAEQQFYSCISKYRRT